MNEREIQSRLKKVWGATGMPFTTISRSDYQSPLQTQLREEWLRWIELGASGVVVGDHGVGKTVPLQKVRRKPRCRKSSADGKNTTQTHTLLHHHYEAQ